MHTIKQVFIYSYNLTQKQYLQIQGFMEQELFQYLTYIFQKMVESITLYKFFLY